MRGDGRLFLRGKVWWSATYVGGREIRESTGTTSKTEAARILRNRQNEMRSGHRAPNDGRVTYAQLRALIVRDYENNQNHMLAAM